MKRWLIEKLGGYPTLDAAVAAIKREEDVTRKHDILTEATKHLFNTIGAEDILRVEGGKWMLKGRPLQPDEVRALREEAELIAKSKLMKLISLDVKYQLNKKMYEESNITMDVMWGKLLLYYHDIVRTRIEKMLKQ